MRQRARTHPRRHRATDLLHRLHLPPRSITRNSVDLAVRGQERAILVGLDLKSRSRRAADYVPYSAEESLEELKALADTAGATVEETVIQSRPAADAATLIGSGKLEELKALVTSLNADVVLFDSELTPTQQRN